MKSFIVNDIFLFEILLFLISIVAGVFGSILGLGGGIIIVPALTLILGIKIKYAIGASIVSVIATSSGAAAVYVRDRLTNIRVAIFLEVATTIGAICGALLSSKLPTNFLFLIFAAMLLFSCWVMYRKVHQEKNGYKFVSSPLATRLKMNSSYPDHHLQQEISYGVINIPLGFTMMTGAGLISGLLGVGSGALKVPAMDGAMNLPIKVSSATSNFMIGVTAAASAGFYYMRGEIIPVLVAPVALGVLAGTWGGTRLMVRLPSSLIRLIFIFVLIFIAIQMGLKGFLLI